VVLSVSKFPSAPELIETTPVDAGVIDKFPLEVMIEGVLTDVECIAKGDVTDVLPVNVKAVKFV
ncbi:hypothetical protein M3M33_15030, partial [Loigolactobacillus coryniformis]|uniref:hypothetical protein n=1 Tax=Loigolactobacillus coryniformis TaxID=1610 RepID=UPI00201A5654